ncbi:hypothetical protein, partial [Pseudomonas proteolytica]
ALGCAAAPKSATSDYLVKLGVFIGAAAQPSAGDAAFRQARSPQGLFAPDKWQREPARHTDIIQALTR